MNSSLSTASSVHAERVFSRGRILLPHTRNRLDPKSVQALMCLGDWCWTGVCSRLHVMNALRHDNGEDE